MHEDPLGVYYRYIIWSQQISPSIHDLKHVNSLYIQTINMFRKEKFLEKYRNDKRFIEICLLYGCTTDYNDAADLYKMMCQHKIGCQSVDFYKQWSEHYEHVGDVKNMERAGKILNQVASKHIHEGHEDFEKLKNARKFLDHRMIRKTLLTSQIKDENTREKQTLKSLVTTGESKKVGSVRITTMEDKVRVEQRKTTKPTSNTKLQVYNEEDDDNDEMFTQSGSKQGKLSEKHHRYKENEKHASQWVGRTLPQTSHASHQSNPAFEVYRDEDDKEPSQDNNTGNKKARGISNVEVYLSEQKTIQNSQYSESHRKLMKKFNDSENVMRMYPVDKVYTPMGEFQIDEVLLARWKVKQKKKEAARKKQEEKERTERELMEYKIKLEKREEQLKNLIQATNEMPNSTMNSQHANNQSQAQNSMSSKAPTSGENNFEGENFNEMTMNYNMALQKLHFEDDKKDETQESNDSTPTEEKCPDNKSSLLQQSMYNFTHDVLQNSENDVLTVGDRTADIMDFFPDMEANENANSQSTKRQHLDDSMVAIEEKSPKLDEDVGYLDTSNLLDCLPDVEPCASNVDMKKKQDFDESVSFSEVKGDQKEASKMQVLEEPSVNQDISVNILQKTMDKTNNRDVSKIQVFEDPTQNASQFQVFQDKTQDISKMQRNEKGQHLSGFQPFEDNTQDVSKFQTKKELSG